MKKLLLAADIPKEVADRLNQVFDVVKVPSDNTAVYELLKSAMGAHAVICDPAVKLEAPIIEILAPTCSIISVCGKEYSNIDIKTATEKGILVCVSDRIFTDAISDMVFALLFAAGRKVVEGNNYVRLGRDREFCPKELLGVDVSLQTIGIMGLGPLSRAVCTRAKAFNMQVLYASEKTDSVLEQMEAKHVSLDDLLAFSDFVSLHDEYVITEDKYEIMKKNCVLINVVNEDLIDEKALVKALENGKVSSVALDVYSEEYESQLVKYENCILTPHMSSATHKKRAYMENDAIRNVLDYFDGKTLNSVVNKKD